MPTTPEYDFDQPEMWFSDVHGWGDKDSTERKHGAERYKRLILLALHHLGKPASHLDITRWLVQNDPGELYNMRSYIYTFGLEVRLRGETPIREDDGKMAARYADYPVDGDWDARFAYTLSERIHHYLGVMRANGQVTPTGSESVYISEKSYRLALYRGPSRQGTVVYLPGPEPLKVRRERPLRPIQKGDTVTHIVYNPEVPDYWKMRDQAMGTIRELIAKSRTPQRKADLGKALIALNQIEHFVNRPPTLRPDDARLLE